MRNPIEVFKSGSHLDSRGRRFDFSEAQLAAIAAGYNPSVHHAPIVLGHPKSDGPAWGWVKGLSVSDGHLVAEHEDVDPAFEEGVDNKRYRYVSCSFYGPDDAANPKPGAYYLRHLGFLGAQPPAIKGLQSPAFAEDDAAEPIEFSDMETSWLAGNVASGFRGLRDWIIGKFGQDEADKALPAWTDQAIATTAATVRAEVTAETGDSLAYSEALQAQAAALADREAALATREAAVAGQETVISSRAAEFAEAELATRRTDDAAYVDSLVTAGRLPPGRRDQVLALFAHAGSDASGPSFSEGEDAHSALRGLLDGLGETIAFREVSAADGFTGQLDSAAIAARTTALVNEANARGETLSFAEAASAASRGN